MQYEFIASKLFWLFSLPFLVTFLQYFSSFMNGSHTRRLLKHSYAFSVVGLCFHPVSLFYSTCISYKFARSNYSSSIKARISFLLENIIAFGISLDNLQGIKKNPKVWMCISCPDDAKDSLVKSSKCRILKIEILSPTLDYTFNRN